MFNENLNTFVLGDLGESIEIENDILTLAFSLRGTPRYFSKELAIVNIFSNK